MAKADASFSKSLGWRLEALGFDLFTAVIRASPTDGVSRFGGWLGRRVGPLTSAHRTAARGLALAFPDMAEAQRQAILGDQWENFGRYLFEFPLVDRLTPALGRVEIVNGERLTDIAASGRPAIFISGHFSNLEVMAAVIMSANIPCEITYRAANNPFVDARIIAGRRRYGIRLLAPKGGEGARELLDALTHGRSIAMLNDQRYDAGVAAPFFGHTVKTNPAAVRLALKFGLRIQPMGVERLKDARFRCTLYEPILLESTGRRAEDTVAGVERINAFIEERVRARPGEWWWLHKRWPAELYRRETATA
jgi:KDO2-lipid IV(A) lauroyltransferase